LLGCGAHVQQLRRLDAGPYKAEQMITLDALQDMAVEQPQDDGEKGIQDRLDTLLLPVTSALGDLPSLALDADQAQRVLMGQRLALPEQAPVELTKLIARDTGVFLGIAEISDDRVLRPRRLLATG